MRKEATKRLHISRRLRRFTQANEAVSALEYAVLVGVITVGIGAALVAFEDDLSTAISNIGTEVKKVKVEGAKALKP